MGTNWYELANRWADKCVYCGCTEQNKITFSVCSSCKANNNKKQKKVQK